MKTDVEKLDPTRVRLSVEVPFEELKPSLDSAYRQIGQQVRVPGFRPGKVPQRVIDARVGRAAVLEQAVNDALPRLYGAAVKESGIDALGQPEVDITQIDDGTALTFTAEVDIRPEIELPPRDAIAVTVETSPLTDADVDEQVEALRERFATSTTVDRPAADGDLVTLDLSASDEDGEPLQGGEATGQTYKIGSGTMLEGLDEAVRGLSVGDEATFTTTLVGTAAGAEATVTARVTAVKEQQLPELDDEFAQLASEFDTVAELRGDTRARLERLRQRETLVGARDAVLEAYVDSIEVPVPERLLAHELEHRASDLDRELASYGLSKEQYVTTLGTTVDEFDADIAARSATAIKVQFVLDAIAKADGIQMDEGELSQQLVNRAMRAGVSPDEYAQQLVQSNQVGAIMSEVLRAKALGALVRAATVRDSEGKTIDVDALEADLGAPQRGAASTTVPAKGGADSVAEAVDQGFGVPDYDDQFLVLDSEAGDPDAAPDEVDVDDSAEGSGSTSR